MPSPSATTLGCGHLTRKRQAPRQPPSGAGISRRNAQPPGNHPQVRAFRKETPRRPGTLHTTINRF
eukprot:3382214-Ditylum_brightwellii.AAC.1